MGIFIANEIVKEGKIQLTLKTWYYLTHWDSLWVWTNHYHIYNIWIMLSFKNYIDSIYAMKLFQDMIYFENFKE